MTHDKELKGDPEEYNPDKGEPGEETVENVPIPEKPDMSSGVEKLDSTDVSWDGDALWFDCPHCGDRLCASWFYSAGSKCDGCGAEITVTITVKK